MITVFVRMRVDDWQRFKSVHDEDEAIARRTRHGNLEHTVLSQLDDATDLVFWDRWSSPQDADDYYHTDAFNQELDAMGAAVVEIIKLEETDAATIVPDM